MKKVLFVCTQNRGRSQMATELFNKAAKEAHADSAGTKVETPGDTLEERAKVSQSAGYVITVLKEEGMDASKNLQTQVTKEMLDGYDKIVVMAEEETIPSWLRENSKFEYWKIEDTRWEELDGLRDARDNIKAKVQKLIQELE